MTSLEYLRGEREIKGRTNCDKRMLSTKISELSAQTNLSVIQRLTWQCLTKRQKVKSKNLNHAKTAQEIINIC